MDKNKKQIRQDFINFLKVRRLYSKFKRNHNPTYTWQEINITEYLKKTHFKYFIAFAFDWRITEEGHKFWADINQEWVVFYKQNYPKNI